MPTFVNLVGTRCKDGDHAMALRWYTDHVQILFGSTGLRRATLCRHMSADAAPDYLCLYEFTGAEAFLAFEAGAPREQARQVLLGGWGKDGIEVTLRTQFVRQSLREDPATAGLAGGSVAVQHLDLSPTGFAARESAAGTSESARWLSDRAHTLFDGARHAQLDLLHAAQGMPAASQSPAPTGPARQGALVMAQAAGTAEAALPRAADWLDDGGQPTWGARPAELSVRWQGRYQTLRRWSK